MQDKPVNRRTFHQQTLRAAAVGAAGANALMISCRKAEDPPKPRRVFRLWASCCAHVGTDLRVHKRESLAEPIRQSERGGESGGPPFEWDAAVFLGDASGNQGSPKDDEGQLVARQLGSGQKHAREQIYCLAGNHDATFPEEETQWWFRKWIDPTGENTAHSGVDAKNRPFPIEGTWERYTFRVGNLLFTMMSDRNDLGPPVGRGEHGGYPAGAVTGETFTWWKDLVQNNQDSIIISAHHHMLKETTIGSGEWEGFKKNKQGEWIWDYHGYFADGAPKGASYLYWVDGKPDAQAFENYLVDNPGAIDLWLGGHTHAVPDEQKAGRTHIERRWGANFVNVAALTHCHGRHRHLSPMSRLFTFTEGSDEVHVGCYLHTSQLHLQTSQYHSQGWYKNVERTLPLSKPFRWT